MLFWSTTIQLLSGFPFQMGTNWENVAEKCCRSHYQPLLLLYANPNGTPIHTAEAPQNVIMAPGFKLGKYIVILL